MNSFYFISLLAVLLYLLVPLLENFPLKDNLKKFKSIVFDSFTKFLDFLKKNFKNVKNLFFF